MIHDFALKLIALRSNGRKLNSSGLPFLKKKKNYNVYIYVGPNLKHALILTEQPLNPTRLQTVVESMRHAILNGLINPHLVVLIIFLAIHSFISRSQDLFKIQILGD